MEKQILSLLQKMNETLEEHSLILKEHSSILSALKTGQEYLSAEISEMRLQNAKDFGEIRAILKNHEESIEILKEDNWNNRKATLRIQKAIELT
jgi:hypothetical protein